MQTERLDWLAIEPPFHGCRVAGCQNEAKNYLRGTPYCAAHAREARDGRLSPDLLHPSEPRTTYVYVLEAAEIGRLKFGQSTQPKKRFTQVNDGSPIDITMLGYCIDPECGKLEAWIHAYLHAHRLKGEWFRDHPDCRMVAGLIIEGRPADLIRLARQ